jgi:hypothetical protein
VSGNRARVDLNGFNETIAALQMSTITQAGAILNTGTGV